MAHTVQPEDPASEQIEQEASQSLQVLSELSTNLPLGQTFKQLEGAAYCK